MNERSPTTRTAEIGGARSILVLALLALLVLGSGGAALLKVGPVSPAVAPTAAPLIKPSDPQQAIDQAVRQIAGFKDVKMTIAVSVETGGHFSDQAGVLYERTNPVLIDIKFFQSDSSGPYEEIENPVVGARCMIYSTGRSQTFRERPHPAYAEPFINAFRKVPVWRYVIDANDVGRVRLFWHIQGDLPGTSFPGRTYESSTVDVYVSTSTGRVSEITTTQAYTTNGGPKTVFIGTQSQFVFNTGAHFPVCS